MAFANAGHLIEFFTTRQGRALRDLSVEIRDRTTNDLVPLYTDHLRTATVANPMTTDDRGRVEAWGEPAEYRMIAKRGSTVLYDDDVVINPYPAESDTDVAAEAAARAAADAALQAELDQEEADRAAHEADTTGVHGIPDTADLVDSADLDAALAALIDAAPGALDTLNELAAALGDDPNFATTITNALALKANLTDPRFREAGGTEGQIEVKQSAADDDVAWTNRAVMVVNHGVTSGLARPVGVDTVIWYGSVAPTNRSGIDLWIDTT